jgi:hypothetical protein
MLGFGAVGFGAFLGLFMFMGKGVEIFAGQSVIVRLALVLLQVVVWSVPFIGIYWTLRRVRRLAEEKGLERRERLIHTLRLPDIRSCRVICLWNTSDEVITLFSILESLTHLPYLFAHHVTLRVVAIILGVLMMPLAISDAFRSDFPMVLRLMSIPITIGLVTVGVVVYGLFVLAVAAIINWVITRLPLGIGGQQAVDTVLVMLTASLAPATSCQVEFYELDLASKSLSHSAAYSDSEALKLIADRMRSLARAA